LCAETRRSSSRARLVTSVAGVVRFLIRRVIGILVVAIGARYLWPGLS
jgi:hypothetical protein